MAPKQIDISQLYKYFNGELSSNEKIIIESWRDASSDNKIKFDQVRMLYLDVRALSTIDSAHKYNVSRAWQKFKSKHIPPRMLELKVSYRALRIAASVAVLVVASVLGYQLSRPSAITIATAGTDALSVVLDDSTVVDLGPGSQLVYPKRFAEHGRPVTLTGQAFFDVQSDPLKPFVINVENVEVQVLGTSFYVDASCVDSIVVSVISGKVWFKSPSDAKMLTPGQTGVYLSNHLTIDQADTVMNHEQIFWHTKTLHFEAASLGEAIKSINSVYHVSISLSDPHLAECTISVHFENETIESILDIISATLALKLESNGSKYTLVGRGCD